MWAPAPADVEDRRLGHAAAWHGAGRSLAQHPLAIRRDLPLQHVLVVEGARLSAAFTAFDGNVSALAATAPRVRRLLRAEHAVTTSRVEMWATCPFQYFLRYVVEVEPTERPEETWTIDALDRGSLVHGILDDFMSEAATTDALRDRLRDGAPYDATDAARLLAHAQRHFTAAEHRGETGHPLVWETAKRTMLDDLASFMSADARWRAGSGLAPTYFEQRFGTRATGAWPAVVISLPAAGDGVAGSAGDGAAAGEQLRFSGVIDRVDVDVAGTTAQVFDYKTGNPDGYRALAGDPVLAGKHVQLAVYALAARQHLEQTSGASGDEVSVRAAFWFVTRKAGQRQVAAAADDGAVRGRLEEVLGVVASGIRAGAFPQVPGAPSRGTWEHCAHCEFDNICPSWREDAWERKQHAPGASIYRSLAPAGSTEQAAAEPEEAEA